MAIGFTVLLVISGLAALIALVRAGIQTFWVLTEEEAPKVALSEIGPVLGLLLLTVALSVKAAPVMHYMEETAAALAQPRIYVEGVLGAPRVEAPVEGQGE